MIEAFEVDAEPIGCCRFARASGGLPECSGIGIVGEARGVIAAFGTCQRGPIAGDVDDIVQCGDGRLGELRRGVGAIGNGRCLSFDVSRLAVGGDGECGIGESRRTRAEERHAGVIAAECDGGLSQGDGDIGLRIEGDSPAGGEFARAGFDGEGDGGRIGDVISGGIAHRDDDLAIIRAIGAAEGRFIGGNVQAGGCADRRRCWRRNAEIVIAIPVPALLGEAVVLEDSLKALFAGDAAVIEAAPDCFAGAPRKMLGLQVAEKGVIGIDGFADRAVLGNHVGDAGIDEKAGTVAVVAGDVAELIDASALAAADGGGARGVQLVAEIDHARHELARAIEVVGEEGFVGHAPDKNGGMIAIDADHLGEDVEAALLEGFAIFGVHGVGRRVPISLGAEATFAPEAGFGPEDQSKAVARIGEGGMMGIVGPANEIEAGLFDEFHISITGGLCDGDTPAGVVLMRVGPTKVEMLAVEEKAAVGSPLEEAQAEGDFGSVDQLGVGGIIGEEFEACGV